MSRVSTKHSPSNAKYCFNCSYPARHAVDEVHDDDDALSTYYRIWYSVWQRGLGGSFLWSLDADYDGKSQDLLDAMYQATITK